MTSDGLKCNVIAQKLNEDRSTERKCTSDGVRKFIKRSKAPAILKPRRTKKLNTEALDFINNEVDKNREISAPKLQRLLLAKLNIKVSVSVIKKERQALGWTQTTTMYCQMVRHVNKEKRLLFCTDLLARGDTFDDVVFTDESTVKCERYLSRQFRKKGEPMHLLLRPKPKHPLSVKINCIIGL